MSVFSVDFYKKENGEVPVQAFLDNLDVKMRNKAIRSLQLLEEFGCELREPNSKSLGDGLFELRIKFANDITRIFYFFFVGNRIILTNGFVKKTVKTPKKEIEKAKTYKKDWEKRNK